MSEYVHLIGSDDVRATGYNIASAAQQMSFAASQIDESLRAHQQFLNDWLQRLESTLNNYSDRLTGKDK